jgi:hypothetical protein
MKVICYIVLALILTKIHIATLAQEVFIPDSGLSAAVIEALKKPSGLLTEQDMFRLPPYLNQLQTLNIGGINSPASTCRQG